MKQTDRAWFTYRNLMDHIALPHRKSSQAFSLAEILVVVAILGILMALLFPAFKSSIERSNGAKCLENLRQISAAINLYAGDNNMLLPPSRSPVRDAHNDKFTSFGAHLVGPAALLTAPPKWLPPDSAAINAPNAYIDNPEIFYSPTQKLFKLDRARWYGTSPGPLFMTVPNPTSLQRIGYFWMYFGPDLPESSPLYPFRNYSKLLDNKPAPVVTTFGIPTSPEVTLRTTENNFFNVLYTDGGVAQISRQKVIENIPPGHNNNNFATILQRMIDYR